jgi:hypothetical protein
MSSEASFGGGGGGSGSAGAGSGGDTGASSSSSSASVVQQDINKPSNQPRICFYESNEPNKKICFDLGPFFEAMDATATRMFTPLAMGQMSRPNPEHTACLQDMTLTAAAARDALQGVGPVDVSLRCLVEKARDFEYTRPADTPAASEWIERLEAAAAQTMVAEENSRLPKTELDMYEYLRMLANAQNPNSDIPPRDPDQPLRRVVSHEKQTCSVTGPDGITRTNEVLVTRYSDGSEERFEKENTDMSKYGMRNFVGGDAIVRVGEAESPVSKPSVSEEIKKTKAAAGEGWFWSASK